MLMMKRSSEELHGLLYETAKQAADQIEANLRQKTADFQRFKHFTPIDTQVTVLTYHELYQKPQIDLVNRKSSALSTMHSPTEVNLEIVIFQRKLSRS